MFTIFFKKYFEFVLFIFLLICIWTYLISSQCYLHTLNVSVFYLYKVRLHYIITCCKTTTNKWITVKWWWTFTYGQVIINVAYGIQTTCIFARVNTFQIDTSLVFMTFIICCTFWPTFKVRISVIFRYARTASIITQCIYATGSLRAKIFWFHNWRI